MLDREKETVVEKVLGEDKLKELAIKYMDDMGHVRNQSCTPPRWVYKNNSVELHFQFNDPMNPAKEEIKMKLSEVKKILAKKLGRSLDDVNIDIDNYK